MNFKANKENQKARDRLMAVFCSNERGAMVEHPEIEKALGINRDHERYYTMVRMVARRHIRERQILIESEAGVGYYLTTVDQQLDHKRKRHKKAMRQERIGTEAVVSLPTHELSAHQTRLRDAIEERAKEAARKARDDAAWLAYAMRAKPSEPLKIHMRNEEQEQTA